MRIPAYSARPQPTRLPLLLASDAFRACTDSPTDAGRPEHDEGDECIEYDLYGWFQFESHADGVQCLARQMWEPPHDLEQAEGWKAAVLKLEERLKMAAARLTNSELRAGGAPVSPEGAGG